ncbi:CHAD domain-containing protein [Pseudomonas sp. NPDC007930]|uniref:CHAD domain-containing protein n=1 Tax=Pseudomonas sp. NPDC007930 TaxID=3364417 RepID=UPI0036EC2E43
MSATLDGAIAELIALETRLMACRERLRAHTDSEALHDLRTTVRRLRSLLRPLRGLPGIDRLEVAAKAVGELTTPLRDREVLAAHLAAHGHGELATPRLRQALDGFSRVAGSAVLGQLMRLLDAVVPLLRTAERNGVMKGLGRRLNKRLGKQHTKLAEALADPAHDRHRLRLLIKRVRYAGEAYPARAGVGAKVAKAFKRAQGALGDWHDRLQWLALAEQQQDLAPMTQGWQADLVRFEGVADQALVRLQKALKA